MSTKTKSQLQDVEIKNIFVSTTNPRKTFDESSMKELTESISKVGVLQPILLRGHKGKLDYELVCGERRLRSAIAAGLEMIPANIRILTDDEAFEMQIIENLERKDVHPLEEADAFKRMLDSGKYQITDIAAKFAKPETFIAQRLKFVDLIEEIKKDFYEGKVGVGQAILIARLGESNQREIFKDAHSQYNLNGYGTVESIRSKSRGVNDLDNAPFGLGDSALYKKAGSCLSCPKRSGANPLLFSDIKEENRCFDSGCYETKLSNFIEQSVADIITEGKDIHLGRNSYSEVPKFIDQLAKSNKVPILKEYDDFTSWGQGKKMKIFMICGNEAGKIIKAYPKQKAGVSVGTAEKNPIQEQIDKIEERAKRALELDDEKVWNMVRSWGDGDIGITMKPEDFLDNDKPLSDWEKKALAVTISERSSYETLEGIGWFKELDIEKLMTYSLPDSVLFQAMRRFIYDSLNNSYGSHSNSVKNAALFQVLTEYFKSEVSGITDHFQDKADKRISRTNAKLEELKAQLPVEEPKKKATPKKSKKNA